MAEGMLSYVLKKSATGLCLGIFALYSGLYSLTLQAQGLKTQSSLQTTKSVTKVLPADSAFKLQAFAEADQSIVVLWDIAEGYYLYRQSISISKSDGSIITLTMPTGRQITDEYKGDVEVYFNKLLIKVPVMELGTGKELSFQLDYQGCASDLYCYPPQQKAISISLP